MAKMTKEIRKVIFEKAINKLYGERLIAEKEEFEKKSAAVVVNMVKRTAKENGVDYGKLTTSYKPYVERRNYFYFKAASGQFNEELNRIFYNENLGVLEYEGAKFEIARDFKSTYHASYVQIDEPQPHTGEESFSEEEQNEFVAIYNKYADFMKGVISSACVISDVINSASTTKQLAETSQELGEFIPETVACTALVPVETVNKVAALFRKN
jgi:hypothetical protein